MREPRTYPGINIQFPISREILSGRKTIETRTYKLPEHYIGRKMLLIETPGNDGDFRSRPIAIITFGRSFKYMDKEDFDRHFTSHKVSPSSPWYWTPEGKWGWPILSLVPLKDIRPVTKRLGIKFTKNLEL